MNVIKDNNNIIVEKIEDFDLGQIMECGQCFHFVKLDENEYGLSAFGKMLHIKQQGSDITFYDTTQEDFDFTWRRYFDLDRDYGHIKEFLLKGDEKLKESIETMYGVRILNQDFFETLISFIISQNKQIPHIKKIVADISRKFGKKLGNIGEEEFYSFPTQEELMAATVEDLKELKTGFRAPYIYDAVHMLAGGEISEQDLRNMAIDECRNSLMKIKGVGMKVANCCMLFGLGKREAFPVDVWIKRIMEYMYFEGNKTDNMVIEKFATDKFGEYGGYAQQYLFYYGKTMGIGKS